MTMLQCPLCKNTTEKLIDSHVLPQQFYKLINELNKKNSIKHGNKLQLEKIQLNPKKNKLMNTDKEWKEHLLCEDCEILFRTKERELNLFLREMFGLNKRTTTKNGLTHKYAQDIKYTILSIFIRQYYSKKYTLEERRANNFNSIPKTVIEKIEQYLQGKSDIYIDMIIQINRHSDHCCIFTEVLHNCQNGTYLFSILLFDICILITYNPQNLTQKDSYLPVHLDFRQTTPKDFPINMHLEATKQIIKNTDMSSKTAQFFNSLPLKLSK